MSIVSQIIPTVTGALKELYGQEVRESELTINTTKPEFEGDYTIVLFSFVKQLRKSPEQLGQELGELLTKNNPGLFKSYNVIKGFLNLVIADKYWLSVLDKNYADKRYGFDAPNGRKWIVEYSSPNTNKPLHLGHLRNNFLGWSVAEILQARGYEIVKTCIVNDRGIHICKSMLAWQRFANGDTPQSTGIKGDHFVGDYYVKFSEELKKEVKPFLAAIYEKQDLSAFNSTDQVKISNGLKVIGDLESVLMKETGSLNLGQLNKLGKKVETNVDLALNGQMKWKEVFKTFDEKEFESMEAKEKEKKQKELHKYLKPVVQIEEKIEKAKDEIKDICENNTEIMKAAQQMLFDWEAGKPAVIALWKKMNQWVYDGFDVTYKRIGSDFAKMYYESETYIPGKRAVEEGLAQKIFYRKDDGSTWIDLTDEGLDEKLVLRKDGTSVYITQDLGLAEEKYKDFHYDQSLYVIADEQNYHMKVLKLILQKLNKPYADGIHHLSYGMVELPTGRMKSREGTVVDADELIEEMVLVAKHKTEELGKVKDFTEVELKELYDTLALGALKFFLLRVDPKKRMVFNPEESIDFHGFTGPFVQYTHARIKSILRKQSADRSKLMSNDLLKLEKDLIVMLEQFPAVMEQAVMEYNPSVIAIYTFNLARLFNTFYAEHSVMNAESEEKKELRLRLSEMTANTIHSAMGLLGIRVPERM